VAYQILGFAGVPDSLPAAGHGSTVSPPPTRPSPVGSASVSPQPSTATSHSPGSKSRSPRSPRPSSSGRSTAAGQARLAISAAQHQITAGDSLRIFAFLTDGGHPAGGARLTLTELAADRSTWRVVAQAVTGAAGRADFVVPSLTTNASFLASGPGQVTSAALSIVVIPSVSVTFAPGGRGQSGLLRVSAPLANAGDVAELEVFASGQWQVTRSRRLHKAGQTAFSVVTRKISVTYRVVLVATAKHGQSVSSPVTIAARRHRTGR
jgi:hypothetical protein